MSKGSAYKTSGKSRGISSRSVGKFLEPPRQQRKKQTPEEPEKPRERYIQQMLF